MGRYSLSDTDEVPSPTFLTAGNPTYYPSEGPPAERRLQLSCIRSAQP